MTTGNLTFIKTDFDKRQKPPVREKTHTSRTENSSRKGD